MPIVTQPTHQPGDYPDTIRHISNGDQANQTAFRNFAQDLEYRTDVLKDFVNALEAQVNSNFSTLDAFDKNHDHSGLNGEQVIDFQQIYDNDDALNATVNLAVGGVWGINSSGGAASLLKVVENGATDKDKVVFPGSAAIHDHVAAPASNLTLRPHSLQLQARVKMLSSGCLVDGLTNGPYTEIVLDPSAVAGTSLAAPGLSGASPSDGLTAEGVLVGDLTSPGGHKDNIVLIHDQTTNAPILVGGHPIYGLLENTGTTEAPVWQLSFFVNGVSHEFATDSTLVLYGQEAFSLTTVPVVDPRFVRLSQTGISV